MKEAMAEKDAMGSSQAATRSARSENREFELWASMTAWITLASEFSLVRRDTAMSMSPLRTVVPACTV